MENGFLKVAALTPHIKVADPMYNAKQICDCIDEAEVSLVFTSTSAPTVVDGSANRSSAVAASVITDRHGHIIHIAKNVTNIFLILLM